LGCCISPCYGSFSLGGRFEIYEPFISLIFQYTGGSGKPRITEAADKESVDTGARLYCVITFAVFGTIFIGFVSWSFVCSKRANKG
jgi:hypothetical protein